MTTTYPQPYAPIPAPRDTARGTLAQGFRWLGGSLPSAATLGAVKRTAGLMRATFEPTRPVR